VLGQQTRQRGIEGNISARPLLCFVTRFVTLSYMNTKRITTGVYEAPTGHRITRNEDGTWSITWPGERHPDSWAETKRDALAIVAGEVKA
jgi:hypothetical protein